MFATRQSYLLSVWPRFFANFYSLDHARLKDHIASMEGGLEAKINEGGKSFNFLFSFYIS